MSYIRIIDGFSGTEQENMPCADGQGTMRVYPLFDGVTVMLTQLETHGFPEDRPQRDRLEINFCVNGRFESHFSSRDLAVLKPGDMAVSTFDGVHGLHSHSDFPLGYYEGVCITVDCAPAEAWMRRNVAPLACNFSALKENLLASQWYAVAGAGPRCEHVFRELFENLPYFDRRTLTLKALELFSLLETIPRAELSREYCSAEQLRLARHLRDHLLTNRNNYVSLARLAEEHQISVSHLQRLFRQVYGMPVYHYIREYRLEQAAGNTSWRSPWTRATTAPANFPPLSRPATALPPAPTAVPQATKQNGLFRPKRNSFFTSNMVCSHAVKLN